MSDEETTLDTIMRLLYQRDAAVFAITSGVTQPEWDELDEKALGRYRSEALYIFEQAEPVWRERTKKNRTAHRAWEQGFDDGLWYGRYEGEYPKNPYEDEDNDND